MQFMYDALKNTQHKWLLDFNWDMPCCAAIIMNRRYDCLTSTEDDPSWKIQKKGSPCRQSNKVPLHAQTCPSGNSKLKWKSDNGTQSYYSANPFSLSLVFNVTWVEQLVPPVLLRVPILYHMLAGGGAAVSLSSQYQSSGGGKSLNTKG